MPLVRCPRCRFSFEAPPAARVIACSQCGGPTEREESAGDDEPVQDRKKTLKIPVFKPRG